MTVVSAPEAASPATTMVPVATPPPADGAMTEAPASPPNKGSDLVEITSPMVGTFYRSPAPDEPPLC